MNGLITKGVGGFYYVKTEQGTYQTRGRGIFRKTGMTLLVGDEVDFELLEDGDGVINRILDRRNSFERPPIANVEQFVVVAAFADPAPNFAVIDKFLIMTERKGIKALLCFNKSDLASEEAEDSVKDRYRDAAPVLTVCGRTGEGLDKLLAQMEGKRTCFAGPSGVGKSTITNRLVPYAKMETGGVSRKTSRGRHTTRHVELFELPGMEGSMVFDTPGFTSFDLKGIEPEELADCYPEFRPFRGSCRFDDCRHIREPDCAVRDAVEQGRINRDRYEGYTQFYQELMEKTRR
ncbi:MAG: ribosome small subunit-dependent GTPase A [Anaerovoracaceae bacterium]|jgi:ribosome biogenesis GTPase